ncbi:MAG: TetR/AcrR family transcriptional regulator [Bacteroidota bacterium]
MKTKDVIKERARLLFNQLGAKNVTLREVAKQLDKSYGNITYHFANKEQLITALFLDMNQKLAQLQTLYHQQENLLTFFLTLPAHSFNITLQYLFFSKDYVELKRAYPEFFQTVAALNTTRRAQWLKLLIQLQREGYLAAQLSVEDLEYIMDLSVGIRMFYFQSHEWNEFDEAVYLKQVNRLLYPYLSVEGKKVYQRFLEEQ